MDEMNNSNNAEKRYALTVESSIVDILPSIVREGLTKLPESKQSQFVEEFKRKKKSVGMAYFFLLICLGMPYGYVGKWGLQWVYWFTGAGFLLWLLYLLFALPGVVKDRNRDIAMEIFRDIRVMS
ncbi:MAG: hypothetical protein K2K03_00010 [Prevotella sp.]|nr:hypothetical protein [Prevotella sp.]